MTYLRGKKRLFGLCTTPGEIYPINPLQQTQTTFTPRPSQIHLSSRTTLKHGLDNSCLYTQHHSAELRHFRQMQIQQKRYDKLTTAINLGRYPSFELYSYPQNQIFSTHVPTAVYITQNVFSDLLIVRIIAGLKASSQRFQSGGHPRLATALPIVLDTMPHLPSLATPARQASW